MYCSIPDWHCLNLSGLGPLVFLSLIEKEVVDWFLFNEIGKLLHGEEVVWSLFIDGMRDIFMEV